MHVRIITFWPKVSLILRNINILKELNSKLGPQNTIPMCAIIRHRKLKACQENAAKSRVLKLIFFFNELRTKILKIKKDML